MVDYDAYIGGSTTMRIRDTGSTVEYWVQTGPQTYNYEQPWSYFVNGEDSPTLYFRMLQGGNWQQFGSFEVDYGQSIRFSIYDTGLGFPTHDFWVEIFRNTVPSPPEIYAADAISSSTIRVKFHDGYEGASPIVERRIGYGLDRNNPTAYADAPGRTADIGGFAPGTKVYFWAQARNDVGWSERSNRGEDTTWNVTSPPKVVTFTNLTQTSVTATFIDKATGGQPILERQIGYGLNSSTPTDFAGNFSGINNITGLSPGRTYYFWARSRNSVGWGPWSARSQVDLVAGARVRDGGTWKRAVPYVKVSGTWRVAMPYVKHAGEWKKPLV